MITAVQRWGNSLALRIPKAFAMETHLENGSEVDVSVQGDTIVISPVRRRRYDLNEMLEAITPENVHPEYTSGEAVGREEW